MEHTTALLDHVAAFASRVFGNAEGTYAVQTRAKGYLRSCRELLKTILSSRLIKMVHRIPFHHASVGIDEGISQFLISVLRCHFLIVLAVRILSCVGVDCSHESLPARVKRGRQERERPRKQRQPRLGAMSRYCKFVTVFSYGQERGQNVTLLDQLLQGSILELACGETEFLHPKM